MATSLPASQARALTMGLEQEYGYPTGILQSLNEHLTGWRDTPSLLPPHRAGERADNRIDEHKQSAARFGEKMAEFDGIVPLAVDAYYRGDKATRKALQGGGFPQEAVDNVHATIARMPKYGGEQINEQSQQVLDSIIGKTQRDLSGVRESGVPQPSKPLQLHQDENGHWRTGDAFFDAVMDIESGGVADAVSPTGATGLFQFTKGTGKQYGLITKDGRDLRKDPHANLQAAQQLAKDNAAHLRKNGIPITPANLYLAHQQGAGGAVEILKAARDGREVSAGVRRNMNLNNGKGKTPAQFAAMFAKKINDGMQGAVDYQVGSVLDGITSPKQMQAAQTLAATPSTASAELAEPQEDSAGIETVEDIDARYSEQIDWQALVDEAFADNRKRPPIHPTIGQAINGVLSGIV